MALAHIEPVEDGDPFSDAVARNIKALLAMRGMQAQELAEQIGVKPAKLSQRLGGHTRWLGAELKVIADIFDVSADVVLAMSEQDFREALARSRCSSGSPMSGDLSDGLDAIGHATRQIPGQRQMALAS